MITRAVFSFGLALAAILTGGCTKHMRERRLLSHAQRDFSAERYDDAELEYLSALQLTPHDPVANRELGFLYYEEGRPERAYFLLKQATTIGPPNFELALKLARVEQAEGGNEEARTAAKALVANYPPTADSLMLLIATSATPTELEESRAIIDSLRAHDQDRACYRLAEGALLLFKGNSSAAEAEFREAVKLDPKSATAYAEIADCVLARHQTKEAGELYRKATELSPLRSAYRLRYISFQLSHGDAAAGREQLEKLDQKAPDYIPGWVFRIKQDLRERRYDDCAMAIQKVLARESRDYDALLQLGVLKLAQGHFDEAIAALERAESSYPQSAPIKYQLGLAHLAKGELARAETSLDQAAALSPGNEDVIVVLADLRVRQRDPAAAIASLIRLLQKNPRSVSAYLVLARAYQAQNRPDRVIAALRRAQRVFPQDPQLPYLLGLTLNAQGQRDEARQMFERAVQIKPDYAPALELLVDTDLLDHRISAARECAEAAVRTSPHLPSPLLLRAKVRGMEGDLAGAEADLHKAVAMDPKSPVAYLLLAKIYFDQHRSREALEELKFVADKTKNPAAIMELALVQTQLQNYDQARETYERLLRIDANFAPALNNLAILYSEHLGNIGKGEALASQAKQLRPDDPAILDTLGWIDFRKGDYAGALTLLDWATEKNPADAEFQYHVGMTHYMLGEEDEARVALQAAAADPVASAFRNDAVKHLEVITMDPATAPASAESELAQLVEKDPTDTIARYRLASIQMRHGSPSEAATNFEALVDSRPTDARPLLALVQLYAGPLHNPARAQELAQSAHELTPNDPASSALLGHVFFQTGDYARSATLLEAARDLPDRPDVAWDLARAQYALGQIPLAEETLRNLLAASPAFPGRADAEAYAALIAAAKDPARATKALPTARRRLVLEPRCLPALVVTAVAAETQKDYRAVAGIYEKILSIDPKFLPATKRLASLYFRHLHDDDKAYKLIQGTKTELPDDPELNKIGGIIAYRKADYEGAVRAFQRVLGSNGDDTEALFYLGMSHNRLQEGDLGKGELEDALGRARLDPEQDREARATLRSLAKSGGDDLPLPP